MSDRRTKALRGLRVKTATAPSADQLAQINQHTLREFAAEDLVVREYVLAHNALDRDNECFAGALLQDFARTLPGKGVFIEGHPTGWNGSGGPAEGKVFAATTESMALDAARLLLRSPSLKFPGDVSEAVVLRCAAYFVKTPDNESFLLKTDAGIGCEVSIGFNAKPERMKDANGIELDAYRWNSPGEALELSHVWLGAQPGARATKSALREETEMDQSQQNAQQTAQQIATLTSERDQHKAALAQHEPKAAKFDALHKAFGDDAKLLDDPAALKRAIDDGRAHRKSLVDALVAHDRQAGVCGDDDATVAKHAEMYGAMATDHLQRLLGVAEARTTGGANPTKGAVTPGDPNAAAPGAAGKTPDALNFGAL